MTIPSGAGREGGESGETRVSDDTDPGLPAATGSVAGSDAESGNGPSTGDVPGGGPVTDSVRDEEPRGMGSAGDPTGSSD